MKIGFLSILTVLFGASAFAATNSPTFIYQGRLLNEAGTAPLTGTATLTLGIFDPAGNCLLYEEQQSVDLTGTQGSFSIQVGQLATTGGKRTANDPQNAMKAVFANGSSIAAHTDASCPTGSYVSSAGAARKLRVTITPQAGSAVTLSPDQVIGSAPQAVVAETLQGKTPAEFLQVTGNGSTPYSLTKTDLDKIFSGGDAQSLHHHDNEYVKLGSTPSFSSVTISGTPAAATDACSKGYADTKFGGSMLDLTSLSEGQSIKWDATNSKWIVYTPATITAASSTASGTMSAAHFLMLENATNTASNNTLVKRDGSGNFSGGTISATTFSASKLKLTKSAAEPEVCDAGSDGLLAMTSGYITCVCKAGTGWVQTSDGVTACNWTSAGTTTISNTVTEGAACAVNGTLGRDANGLILSCQSGLWAKASGSGVGIAAYDAIALQKAAAGRTVSCTMDVAPGTSGSVASGTIQWWVNNRATVTYSVAWDSSGIPTCRFQETSPGTNDSGWIAVSSIGNDGAFNCTAPASILGTISWSTLTNGSYGRSGAPNSSPPSISVNVSVNPTNFSALYTMTGNGPGAYYESSGPWPMGLPINCTGTMTVN